MAAVPFSRDLQPRISEPNISQPPALAVSGSLPLATAGKPIYRELGFKNETVMLLSIGF